MLHLQYCILDYISMYITSMYIQLLILHDIAYVPQAVAQQKSPRLF